MESKAKLPEKVITAVTTAVKNLTVAAAPQFEDGEHGREDAMLGSGGSQEGSLALTDVNTYQGRQDTGTGGVQGGASYINLGAPDPLSADAGEKHMEAAAGAVFSTNGAADGILGGALYTNMSAPGSSTNGAI